jgi:hypothetical protein
MAWIGNLSLRVWTQEFSFVYTIFTTWLCYPALASGSLLWLLASRHVVRELRRPEPQRRRPQNGGRSLGDAPRGGMVAA